MSLQAFIPNYWASSFIEVLERSHVFGQENVVNRDYEGDIREAGDTVTIAGIGEVAIFDYTKNSDMPAAEALAAADTKLIIDQAKGFNFFVDDVDRRQGIPGFVNGYMRRAARNQRDRSDTLIAGFYASAGSAVATSGAPKTDLGTAGKAYEYLVDLSVLLDENDVPAEERWVAVPPWYHGALLKDDRFVKSGTAGGEQRLLNGQVGEAAGFAVLKSNNVSNDGTTYRVMAGVPMAITFAEQLDQIEAYRPERRFGDAIKGLRLYGAKVTRPEALAVAFVNRPT